MPLGIALIRGDSAGILLRKLPAHLVEHAIAQGRLTREDWEGNRLVDLAANGTDSLHADVTSLVRECQSRLQSGRAYHLCMIDIAMARSARIRVI